LVLIYALKETKICLLSYEFFFLSLSLQPWRAKRLEKEEEEEEEEEKGGKPMG